MSPRKLAEDLLGGVRRRVAHRLRFGGRFALDDRRQGSDTLVMILAGFREYLWPCTLERIARFAPDGADVCVVSAGVRADELAAIAARHGWSYLSTNTRRLATAQNIAIREHPQAEWVFKIDEDVLPTEGSFDRLRTGYRAMVEEGSFTPGFVAPVLNVNGFSYVQFLDTLGLRAEYVEEFGGTPRACTGIPIHGDGRAAAWVWRHSVPLDEVGRTFAERPFGYSTVPHRFSTGFILFRRELWEDFRGLRAGLNAPGLGEDEAYICKECVGRSRVIAVIHNAFAGHYSFGRQEETMRGMFDELRPGLEVAGD